MTELCYGIMGVLLCTVQLVNISVSLNERHLYSVLFRELSVLLTHEPTICCRHGVYLPVYELVFDQITKPQFVELEYTVRTLVFDLSSTCEYSACIFS